MSEKKIAIVGKASNSQMLAPYEDESWEIWGLSNAYMEIPKWDQWFELHDWEYHRRSNPEHYKWLLTDHGKPIWTFQDKYHNAPCAKAFPKDEIMGMFGSLYNNDPTFRYWTNSPSWMMALAIIQGATHIGMWGVDMAMSDEYAVQRPSCELMIGYCMGKGIQVTIPDEASLCKAKRLYGFDTHQGDGYVEVRTRETSIKQKLVEANDTSTEASQQRQMFLGGLNEINAMAKEGQSYKPEERIGVLKSHLEHANGIFEQCEKKKLVLQGALEDLSWVKTVLFT